MQRILSKHIRIPSLSARTAQRYCDMYSNKILRQVASGGGTASGNNILNIPRRILRNIKTRHKITVIPALNINTRRVQKCRRARRDARRCTEHRAHVDLSRTLAGVGRLLQKDHRRCLASISLCAESIDSISIDIARVES